MYKYVHKEDILILFFKWYITLSGEFKLNKKNTLISDVAKQINTHSGGGQENTSYRKVIYLLIDGYSILLCSALVAEELLSCVWVSFLQMLCLCCLLQTHIALWGLVKHISRLGHLCSPAELVIMFVLHNTITFLVEITAKLMGFSHTKLLGRSRFFSGGRKKVESNDDWYKPSH